MFDSYLDDPAKAAVVDTLAHHLFAKSQAQLTDGEWELISSRMAAHAGPLERSMALATVRAAVEAGGAPPLLKAGEGTRGGHVIGHTKSGKPIYDAGHEKYQTRSRLRGYNGPQSPLSANHSDVGPMMRERFGDYSKEDHLEAAAVQAKHREDQAEEHGHAYHQALSEHGDRGTNTSGGAEPHFPEPVKDRLRDLAHGASDAHGAAAAHYAAAGKRAPFHHSEFGKLDRSHVYSKAPKFSKAETGAFASTLRGALVADALLKAAGEGSRGGKIIGHTKTGKPIYSGDHESYGRHGTLKTGHFKGWTDQDHKDAGLVHGKQMRDLPHDSDLRKKSALAGMAHYNAWGGYGGTDSDIVKGAGESCHHCKAVHERGDDGRCNRCGKDFDGPDDGDGDELQKAQSGETLLQQAHAAARKQQHEQRTARAAVA